MVSVPSPLSVTCRSFWVALTVLTTTCRSPGCVRLRDRKPLGEVDEAITSARHDPVGHVHDELALDHHVRPTEVTDLVEELLVNGLLEHAPGISQRRHGKHEPANTAVAKRKGRIATTLSPATE